MSPVLDAAPEYRESMERLFGLMSGEVFQNSQPAHVRALYELFLKRAARNVLILTKNLPADVFDAPPLIHRVETALRDRVRVDIIVQSEPEATSFLDTYRRWKTDPSLKIRLDVATDNPSVTSLAAEFAVLDSRAYRFVPQKGNLGAYACMYNPELAQKLAEVFSRAQFALS